MRSLSRTSIPTLCIFISVFTGTNVHAQAVQNGLLGQKCTVDSKIDGGTPVEEKNPLKIVNAVSPGRTYARAAPRPFNTLVFHDPGSSNCNPYALIAYGNRPDPSKGNIAYGYHFYIALDGTIYQAADLNRRTNHVGRNTRGTASGYDNGNAVGVSLMCGHRQIPQAQLDAARNLGHALQLTYNIQSNRIFGHGELQTNRSANEGLVAARSTRNNQARNNTQLKYNLPNGTPVICQIEGTPPPACKGNECESNTRRPGVMQPNQNTGYPLPPPTGPAGTPTTDSRAWGYPTSPSPAPSNAAQKLGPADQPNPVNPDGSIRGGSFTPSQQQEKIEDEKNESRSTKKSGTSKIELIAKPKLALPDTEVKVGWRTTNVASCTLEGPQATSKKKSGIVTFTIEESGTYTLTCKTPEGKSLSTTADVTLATE